MLKKRPLYPPFIDCDPVDASPRANRRIMVLLAASAIRGLHFSSIGTQRTLATLGMQTNEPTIVVGLDGVLIDSEPATTRCAWLTAQSLWPEIMDAVTEVSARQAGVRKAWVGYDWSALTGVEEATGMPSWLGAKLRQLRPVVRDGGYEAVLLARLCAEEALASSKGDRGARPLSVGEIELGWQEGLRDVLMARYGVTKQELAAASEAEEEAWRCADATGWLAANGFFPGALEALRRCDAEARCRLLLLSRRPSRQAQHSPGPHAHPALSLTLARTLTPIPTTFLTLPPTLPRRASCWSMRRCRDCAYWSQRSGRAAPRPTRWRRCVVRDLRPSCVSSMTVRARCSLAPQTRGSSRWRCTSPRTATRARARPHASAPCRECAP